MSDPICPFVYWGQSEEYVFLSIKITQAQINNIDIQDEVFFFSALGLTSEGLKLYEFTLSYYLPIVSIESRYFITDRSVNVKFRKELKDPWPRLTLKPERLPWVRSDFDRYQFEDSDLEDEGDQMKVEVIKPSEEERAKHNAEQLLLEDEEEWEAFINLIKHPLTIYLFLYNIIQLAGFIYIFSALIYSLIKNHDRTKNVQQSFYNLTIDRLVLLQFLTLLDLLHICLGWIKKKLFNTLVQVFRHSLILFLIVVPHSELHSDMTLFWLFISWSGLEIVRYLDYVLSVLSFESAFITYLRHTIWIPLYPIKFMCEGKLIIRVLPLLQSSRQFCLELPNSANISFDFPIFLQFYILISAFGFYYLMRRQYVERRKTIGPRPIVGSDQMGFFSFISYLHSFIKSKQNHNLEPKKLQNTLSFNSYSKIGFNKGSKNA